MCRVNKNMYEFIIYMFSYLICCFIDLLIYCIMFVCINKYI